MTNRSGAHESKGAQQPPNASGVDLLERPCARAELLLGELVERRGGGVEVSVEVFGIGREIEKAGETSLLTAAWAIWSWAPMRSVGS